MMRRPLMFLPAVAACVLAVLLLSSAFERRAAVRRTATAFAPTPSTSTTGPTLSLSPVSVFAPAGSEAWPECTGLGPEDTSPDAVPCYTDLRVRVTSCCAPREGDTPGVLIYDQEQVAWSDPVRIYFTPAATPTPTPVPAYTVAGVMTDEAGAPLGGVEVNLYDEARTFSNTATTDAAGAFRFEGVGEGTQVNVVPLGGSRIFSPTRYQFTVTGPATDLTFTRVALPTPTPSPVATPTPATPTPTPPPAKCPPGWRKNGWC